MVTTFFGEEILEEGELSQVRFLDTLNLNYL